MAGMRYASSTSLDGYVRTEAPGQHEVVHPARPLFFSVLSDQHHGLQSFQSVAEHLTLVGKGNVLLHRGPDPKELARFLEGAAEA